MEPLSETTTNQIIQRVLQGDTEAYAEIIKRYQTQVWRIVVAPLYDIQSAEALTSQVFVDAFLNLSKFDTKRDFSAWIRAIARNHLRTELRNSQRRDKRLQVYRAHVIKNLEHSEDESDNQGMLESLKQCQERLSSDARNALELRYTNSQSFEEIARVLGRTVDGTRQLIVRTRLILKECIERRTVNT